MRYYSATAGAMSLTAGISSSDTSITLDTVVGLPSSFPFSLVLDPGQATEEIVQVTAAAGSTLTVSRGFDGTSAQAHSLGATARHMMIPADLREPQQHMAATSAHGVSGDVVGTTDVQTVTNKTAVAANKDTAALVVKDYTGQVATTFAVKDELGNTYLRVGGSQGTGATFQLSSTVDLNKSDAANLFKSVARFTASAADVVPLTSKAAGSQTADILQVQKSDGTVLARFDKDGNITAANLKDQAFANNRVTAVTGWTLSYQRTRQFGPFLCLEIQATNATGAAVTATATGHLTDTPIASVNSGFRPVTAVAQFAWSTNGVHGTGYVSTTGEVRLQDSFPNGSIANGDIVSLTVMYPLY